MAPKTRISPSRQQIGYAFEGHLDFYGYYEPASGWIVGGWVAHPWPAGGRAHKPVAVFVHGETTGLDHGRFYPREDVAGRGIGFVFLLRGPPTKDATLRALRLQSGDTNFTILPGKDLKMLAEPDLVGHLQKCFAGRPSSTWQDLLQGKGPIVPRPRGGIDFYGHHALAGGWMFCGWINGGPFGAKTTAVVSFETADISGEGIVVTYLRDDLPAGAFGLALFVPGAATALVVPGAATALVVPGAATALGELTAVTLEANGRLISLLPNPATSHLSEVHLRAILAPVLEQAPAGAARARLNARLTRRPFSGEHSLGALRLPVVLELDEVMFCGAGGLLLMGWLLAKPNAIAAIRVRSGALSTTLDLARCIWLDRPDVLEKFADQGFDDVRCGFIAFLKGCVSPGFAPYIEVETTEGQWGYCPLPPARLGGLPAIKRLLAAVDVRFGEVQNAFDHVLGPAVEALNATRLAKRPGVALVEYGHRSAAPAFSVIIPLHGRLDFVEYQMALFSAEPRYTDIEFIYVLDDPPKRREAQYLFTSVYERCLVPMRALLLDRNVGFAPACNIGLRHATAPIVAFLNSDVFPGTPDWLPRLAARLGADPKLGIVAPWLLYEDGSVQHRGMVFERLAEFGGWHFGQHIGKAQQHKRSAAFGGGALQRCISLTGACMVMARALAERVGGFDEVYAVGDFEDSDLCLKVQTLGLACAVDPEVQLYHLERQSQADGSNHWRQNLTVYNAWQHERRWGQQIARVQAATRAL